MCVHAHMCAHRCVRCTCVCVRVCVCACMRACVCVLAQQTILLPSLSLSVPQLTKFHYAQVRVKFEGEEGSGPGVNRGFFASLSNELKSADTSKPVLKQV